MNTAPALDLAADVGALLRDLAADLRLAGDCLSDMPPGEPGYMPGVPPDPATVASNLDRLTLRAAHTAGRRDLARAVDLARSGDLEPARNLLRVTARRLDGAWQRWAGEKW